MPRFNEEKVERIFFYGEARRKIHEIVRLFNAARPGRACTYIAVLGSNGGIGEAIAYEFCHQGASVTINGRNTKKLATVHEKCEKIISSEQKVLSVPGDIRKEEIRNQLVDDTIKAFGKIDIVINNAGFVNSLPISKNMGLEYLDDMLDIHLRAPYHLSKLSIPELIKNKGVLINISSSSAINTLPLVSAVEYGVAKSALDQFTRWAAYELGPKGVRALTINPGFIETDFGVNSGITKATDDQKGFGMFAPHHALLRIGGPEEVATVTAFMASEDASFVTGVNLLVDGGMRVVPPGPSTPSP